MSSDVVISSLLRAVEAAPGDVPLRVHLAEQLVAAGRTPEAIQQCGVALQHDPTHEAARAVMMQAMGMLPAATPTAPSGSGEAPSGAAYGAGAAPDDEEGATDHDPADQDVVRETPSFDWAAAERGFDDGPAPMFVDGDPDAPVDAWEVEKPRMTLADVGGLDDVKQRLELSFLAPMRNPEMRKLYGKSLRGGLLLYGPPGCGKTFIARAVAGELGARFISVGINDVLDMYIGNSEGNLHALFEQARREAPVVLFLDEIDALGGKRVSSHATYMRNVVNQLLMELDGYGSDNEGVFVMAATNQPWDVDPALRRPGRLDRTVLVVPPDQEAREAILRHHLTGRPVEGIDLRVLASRTPGLTGADLALVCESASERAMMDGIRSGQVRMIRMPDLLVSAAEVSPSTAEWFTMARNVVQFADAQGTYKDLRDYMKRMKLL